MYYFNPLAYRSPQRVWDAIKNTYVDLWYTVAEFTVTLPDKRSVTVPKGFYYDKASVPRLAWRFLPRDDRTVVIAALIHDYLYEYQNIEGEAISREEADKIFYDLIKQSGMSSFKAYLVHSAVRLGGWSYWNKRAKTL